MSEANQEGKPAPSKRTGNLPARPRPPLLLRMLVSGTVTGMGLIALIYLANPGLGVIELIPDNLPFGNIDEAGATAILLMTLSYWGVDVTRLGGLLGNWSAGKKALPPGKGEAGRTKGG